MRTRIIGSLTALALAIAGSVTLVSYVNATEDRVLAGERTVSVLVVGQHVPEGASAGELSEAVSEEQVPVKVAADGSVSSLAQLDGLVTTTDLQPGEQVLSSRFVDPAELVAQGQVDVPDGFQQVSILLEPQRALGGQIEPGDTVGVFASFTDGTEGDDPTTHLTLHKLLVTRVQGGVTAPAEPQPEAEGADGADGAEAAVASTPVPNEGVMVTVAVTAIHAERLVFAAEHGTVWLSDEPDNADEGTQVQTKETIYQ